jgi:hypothetical protein
MVTKTIYLRSLGARSEAAEFVTALRSLLAFQQIALNWQAAALVLRDTADKVALAEKIAAIFDKPDGADAPTPVSTSAGVASGVFANPMDREARRARLESQLRFAGVNPAMRLTFRLNKSSREAFEDVAERAGLPIGFHPQFASNAAFAFSAAAVDLIGALDLLAFQTGNYWQIRDNRTLYVATDNPTVRKAVEPTEIRTIVLNDVVETIAALRVLVSLGNVEATASNAITIIDTPDKIALAERIVADPEIPGRTPFLETAPR